MSPPTAREMRIDFIRGLGVVMLTLDHFGFFVERLGLSGGVKVYTYQSLGWSSAAEFFVFFSGYVLALTYARTLASSGFALTQLRGAHRAWELYVRNALIYLLVLLIAYLGFAGDTSLFEVTLLDRQQLLGAEASVAFMLLQYSPAYLEILQLYIVLVLIAPGFLWLLQRSTTLALGLSFGLWLLVQIDPSINFRNEWTTWNFNPFAWQLIFCLGMWSARAMPLDSLSRAHLPTKLMLAGGAFLACTVVKFIDKQGWSLPLLGTLNVVGIDKHTVGPLRLAHFLLALYLLVMWVPRAEVLARSALARATAMVGTHSLDCFCVSILMSYASLVIFLAAGAGAVPYLTIGALNVVAIYAAAQWFRWFKSEPWRRKPPRADVPVLDKPVTPSANGADTSPTARLAVPPLGTLREGAR